MPTYGGGKNPAVQLDPWQTIVEVGWPTRVTHIALGLSINARTIHQTDSEYCDPPTLTVDDPGWDYTYLLSLEYYFPGPGLVASKNLFRETTGWTTDGSGDVTMAGLPGAPAPSSYGAWQHRYEFTLGTIEETDPDTLQTSAENNLAGMWRPDVGADTTITVPGHGGVFFQTGVTPTFALYGFDYTSGDPSCLGNGLQSTVRPFSLTHVYLEPFPITIEDVIAEFKGRTYQGMAARVIPLDAPPHYAYEAWVLCELVEETPTP